MKLIIFGPPGSGKGTQAKLLAKYFKLKHFCTGDLLREEIHKNNSLSKKIKTYVDRGDLVPQNLINSFIRKFIPKDNFILDGYPRRIESAKILDKNKDIDYVIVLDVPFHILKARLLKRAEIEGRTDDNADVIKERFKVYRKETAPLLKYYKDKILLIDGDAKAEDIKEDLIKILKK